MNLTQAHITKVKVIVYTLQKILSAPFPFMGITLIGMIHLAIVVHDQGVVVVGVICPFRTCLVLIESFIEKKNLTQTTASDM